MCFNIKQVAKELAENIGFEDMVFVLYSDGETTLRMASSYSEQENEVIYTIPTSINYWAESLAEAGIDHEEVSDELVELVINNELQFAVNKQTGLSIEWV